MEFWLTPETDDSPAGIAKNEDGELVLCDDCPCETAPDCVGPNGFSLATSYFAAPASGTTPISHTLTLVTVDMFNTDSYWATIGLGAAVSGICRYGFKQTTIVEGTSDFVGLYYQNLGGGTFRWRLIVQGCCTGGVTFFYNVFTRSGASDSPIGNYNISAYVVS